MTAILEIEKNELRQKAVEVAKRHKDRGLSWGSTLSSRRRRTYVLASVRCSNRAYGFPVHGFRKCAFAA